MARKHKHEEHLNAEAWAIPYGDLVTLLLALFVVMYAMSSVNEGKYRVMSEAMSEAFHGTPRTLKPVQVGDKTERGLGAASRIDLTRQPPRPVSIAPLARDPRNPMVPVSDTRAAQQAGGAQSLQRIAREVEQAMQGLIAQNLIAVHRQAGSLEIEIKTDILFASGVAEISPPSRPVLLRLGQILRPFDNPLRVEGHTDNRPIATASYPSNWELSSARAASVVHVLLDAAVEPARLSVGGFGEYRPVADNATAQGRNANRRVVIVVLAGEGEGDRAVQKALGAEADEAVAGAAQVARIESPQAPMRWPSASDPGVRLAP